MINKPHFYTAIREQGLFKTLTQAQVNSIDAILNECDKQGVDDIRHVAYIFATAYFECYNPHHPETRMTPMVEFGGLAYLKSKVYYPYVGRGFSQLTWIGNYKKEGARMGLDLMHTPELLLDPLIAANSHVYCMVHGSYTGKKLSDYINADKCDYVNARRIINGINKANEIAEIAVRFECCVIF